MDMSPPQAPPAIVSAAQQETLDALHRLVAVQAWLAGRQQELPDLPAPPLVAARDTWLDALDAFWRQPIEDAPGANAVPRIDALATRLASVMRDDALVRRLDGTLDAEAAELAERFARSGNGQLPEDLEARSLRVGDVDYAGAIIVLARDHPGLVLRFMPDRGWDVFDGLDALHAETEIYLRQELARRRELPGLRADDTARIITMERFVGSAPLQTDVFANVARRIAALQRERVYDAWPSAGESTTSPRFVDEATAALDLHDKLDIFALLVAREVRLATKLNEQRLARVPTPVAQGWRHAMQDYRLARWVASPSDPRRLSDAPLSLAAWIQNELVNAFARRRITVVPDDVQVEINEGEEIPGPVDATAASAPPTRMSLAEFALRNTGYFDGRRLHVVTAGRWSDPAGPSARSVREVSRELNLAPRFAEYLRERVSDPQGRAFRTATMRLQQARMRVDAAEARLATYLPGEPTSFLDDRDERGYRMVEAVLDGPVPATRRHVGDHRITVRQLVYQGAVVSDVLVIGVRDARSSPRVVLYTPDAPDGISFREFSDREAASRQFLYAPAFGEYLLQRLPAEYGEPLPGGIGRRFRVSEATRLAHWVLSAPGDGRGTITEAPFEERVVDGDVRTALFDAEIVRQVRDVAWLGRSTAQADREAIGELVRVVLQGTRGPGGLLEDTLGAVGQALRATWRFYDSVKASDGKQAFLDFTDAYTASLRFVGWPLVAARGVRVRLTLPPRGNTLRATESAIGPVDARQVLDRRYAVRGIDLGTTRPDALGMYAVNGHRYIRQREHVFELIRDRTSGAWRLARPGALDGAYPGPALEPLSSGGWRVRTDIGLRGGSTDPAAFAQSRDRQISGRDLMDLTEFQRWTFQQSFIRRLRNGGEASLLYWNAISESQPRAVTLRQHTAWNDALRTAWATPAAPLPVGAAPGPAASWRVLPPDEWPPHLWHYPGRGIAAHSGSPLVLPLQAVQGSGLTGLPVTARAPGEGQSVTWLRLHLDRYRGRAGTAASPGIRIIEDRRGPEATYVIQPDVGFPVGFLGLDAGDFTAGGPIRQ
jgi:hypothetical protein